MRSVITKLCIMFIGLGNLWQCSSSSDPCSTPTTRIFSRTPHTIAVVSGPRSVYAQDIDGDGDMDVLSASQGHSPPHSSEITWYENGGDENLTPHTITTGTFGGESVYVVDMDGDGDMDLVSASVFDKRIAWHENDGS